MTARAAAALVAAIALAGCASSSESSVPSNGDSRGGLVWTAPPRLLIAEGLPDRVIQGRVRNDSLEPLAIRTEEVEVVDAAGRRLEASVVFTDAFTKPLYPQDRGMTLPDRDRRRLGQIVELRPGQEAPLTVGFRQPAGTQPPARIRYGRGWLTIGRTERVTPESRPYQPRGN